MEQKTYKAYLCEGNRESGAFGCYGKDYIEAALNFGNHWNECGFFKFGRFWKEVGKKEGLPKEHRYLIDNLGNNILLIENN
jgi:hypothetical protein